MKKVMVIFFVLGLIIGCGGKKDERKAKYQGVTENVDYISQGMKYLSQQDVQRAIKSFDEAIRQDPKNTKNYLVLGEVYMRLKIFEKAADSFAVAVRLEPENGDAYYLLAVSSAMYGNKVASIDAAQKSAEVFMKIRDEEKLKRSLVLIKELEQAKAPDQATN